jgi:hypothetical protein
MAPYVWDISIVLWKPSTLMNPIWETAMGGWGPYILT